MKTLGYVGLFLGMMCAAVPSWAWVKDYQTRYLLGDNDSRLSAKQNALSQLQLQAMQEAGTYIQGQTQLLNEQLEERISQVSAAIVKLDVLAERFELTAQGQQVLHLSARANVDESILQDRVRALQFEANKVRSLDKLAQDNQQMSQQLQQMQQQKLALENQLLRQKLSKLEQQPPIKSGAVNIESNAISSAVRGASVMPERPQLVSIKPNEAVFKVVSLQGGVVMAQEQTPTAADEPSFLNHFTQALQQTPVMVRINADEPTVKVQPDWQLSLAPKSPLANLCSRWTCVLGYAYKAAFNDALVTPLHLRLFKPFSRVVHIDDKYISHWQLLTLQVYPPNNLNAQDAELIENYRLMVRVNIDKNKLELPLVQYDKTQGALVVALQGAVSQSHMTPYNYQSKEGNVMCALTNSANKQCANTNLTQFVWHTIAAPFAKGVKMSTQIVRF